MRSLTPSPFRPSKPVDQAVLKENRGLVESIERRAFLRGTLGLGALTMLTGCDVTNKDANKGAVVAYLSDRMSIPAEEIATIGDQPNDVLMFKRSGFSIAMGNAPDEVKAQAAATTDSYNDEGFAKAMERFILGSAE